MRVDPVLRINTVAARKSAVISIAALVVGITLYRVLVFPAMSHKHNRTVVVIDTQAKLVVIVEFSTKRRVLNMAKTRIQ